MRIQILAATALLLLPILPIAAAEPATSATGRELKVFPGDKFYFEGEQVEVPVLEISNTFESRMPGSMRIRFSFAIDAKKLRFSRTHDGWDYFAAPEGKARAWHGLVGNVLAKGDTVGVRINERNGEMEWFVENSRHNGFTTIWHRPVKPGKDVEVKAAGTEKLLPDGGRVRGLEYLGTRDNQIRVRYEEFGESVRREEFYFPISAQMPMEIGVMGLRAEVIRVDGVSATIKITRGFGEIDFALPADMYRTDNDQ